MKNRPRFPALLALMLLAPWLAHAAEAEHPAVAKEGKDHPAHLRARVIDGTVHELLRQVMERSGKSYAVGPGLKDRASANLEALDWKRALEVAALVYEFHAPASFDGRLVRLRARLDSDSPPIFPPPSNDPVAVKVFPQPRDLNPLDVISALRLAVPDSARVDVGPNATVVYRGTPPGGVTAEAFLKKLASPQAAAPTPRCTPFEVPGAKPVSSTDEVPLFQTMGMKDAGADLCRDPKAELSFHGETTSVHRIFATLLGASGKPFLISPNVSGELSLRATGPWDCLAKELASEQKVRFLETPDGVLLAVTEDDRLLEAVPPTPEAPRICFFAIPTGKDMDKYVPAARLALTRNGRLTLIRPLGIVMIRDTAVGLTAAEDVIKRFNAADAASKLPH